MENKKLNNQKMVVFFLTSLILGGCSLIPSRKPILTGNSVSLTNAQQQLAAQNKAIVIDFYQGIFLKHQVSHYADQYLAEKYIQHNPHVQDGKTAFVHYFKQYFKQNPEAQNQIKHVIAADDLVFLHVHSIQSHADRGNAIVDIFRVVNGKIVEHWDVIQAIPEQSANANSMF